MYKNIHLVKRRQLESQTITMQIKNTHELLLSAYESSNTTRMSGKVPLSS